MNACGPTRGDLQSVAAGLVRCTWPAGVEELLDRSHALHVRGCEDEHGARRRLIHLAVGGQAELFLVLSLKGRVRRSKRALSPERRFEWN